MSEKPRVRFAPSPTGYLHVGGARTALFNWLFARHEGGVFILRIEDTDLERSTDEMVTAITDGLTWLGLDWDEGPVFQSQRLEAYREAADSLLASGHAYRCFCDADELEAERLAAREKGESWTYDGRCRLIGREESERRAGAGEPFAIRFKVPKDETISFHDALKDYVSIAGEQIEDFVLLRTGGQPTYQLACVVDDAWLRITHVIRGDDHLNNVPKQILLYRALGYPIPAFAHLPLILGMDGKRLSKRHGATSVGEYREKGYLPEAVVNFLALLGWSPKDDTEFMRRDELVSRFAIEGLNRKPAAFDETKLEWLNGQYLNLLPSAELVAVARGAFEKAGIDIEGYDGSYLTRVVDLLKERVRLADEFSGAGRFFFTAPEEYEEESVAKRWKNPAEVIPRLQKVAAGLRDLAAWDHDGIEGVIRSLAEAEEVGAGKYIHPVRVALTGRHYGPGLFELIELLGREEVGVRMERAITWLRGQN